MCNVVTFPTRVGAFAAGGNGQTDITAYGATALALQKP